MSFRGATPRPGPSGAVSSAVTCRPSDVQFLLDVIVGTVLQRTPVMREPMTEGLAGKLLDLLLPGRDIRPRHLGGKGERQLG